MFNLFHSFHTFLKHVYTLICTCLLIFFISWLCFRANDETSRVILSEGHHDDGYVWRKYGEKKINRTHFKRYIIIYASFRNN
jgi:hypothetical protein